MVAILATDKAICGYSVVKSWLNSHLNKLRHLVCESCSNWATETRMNTGFVGGLWQNVQIEHFFTPFFFPECSLKNQHKCWDCDIEPCECFDLRNGKKKGIRGGWRYRTQRSSAVGIADTPYERLRLIVLFRFTQKSYFGLLRNPRPHGPAKAAPFRMPTANVVAEYKNKF